jgi:hypothetical protein
MKNLDSCPYLARQLSDGEVWTAHGGVNPCGLVIQWGDRELRTRRSHTSTRNTENTTSLYWFGPPESNTLRPVAGVDCLRIGRGEVIRDRLVRLILVSG